MRRRMMMETTPAKDWDVAWDYTMGLPEDNGFEKFVQGTPTITLVDDGLNIVNLQDYYVRYAPIGFETCNEGIYEAEVVFQNLPNVSGVAGFRMILSDGEKGCQISTDIDPVLAPVVKYNHGRQAGDVGLIKIKDISYNVDYVFRIERINQQNRIYLNNELIHQSDIPSGSFATGNRIFFQYSPLEATLKSIKFKKIS